MSKRRVGKEGLTRQLLVLFFVLGGLGILPRVASAGTITVAWDLMNDDAVTGYRVYVGTSSGKYSQSFDVAADRDFFIFRNAFMGVRYYFAVAAQFDNERIGPRSLEVTAVGTRTVAGGLPGGARLSDPPLASDCGIDCFVVTEVAGGLAEISSLAVAHDGTVFAVEAGRRVVVLHGGVSTVLEADPGTTIRDIALDPRYDSTGRVFVSMIRSYDRSTGELEVVRLRYLAGALGEPSTIVTGPVVPLAARAPLAIGDDGLVYLALPSLLARHPYSAAVLAFDQDGRLPAGQPSPVVARGLATPVDLAWDGESRSLWLAGENTDGDVQLLALSREAAAAAAASNVLSAGEQAAGVAVAGGVARRLLVTAGVDLVEAAPGTGDVLRISLENYGRAAAVAAAGNARYVATHTAGAADTYRVLKVEAGDRGAP